MITQGPQPFNNTHSQYPVPAGMLDEYACCPPLACLKWVPQGEFADSWVCYCEAGTMQLVSIAEGRWLH